MAEQDRKSYWKSLGEREHPGEATAGARDEFPGPLDAEPTQLGRRGFLRAAGFSFAGAALTGCQTAPVEKAIPFLVQPEEITPGRALHYASTCGACSAACGLLVKNRDGRPIKLEGNPDHPLSRGGLCAVGQASILGLYDSQRLTNPLRDGVETTWETVDREVIARLAEIRERRGAVRFLTGTVNSPTVLAQIASFLSQFPNAKHVVYDPLSSSAILDAHERTHGVRVLPRYRFEKAEVIVSFDADFLGTWFSPVEHTRGYHEGRRLEVPLPRASHHVQFESRMSLTGAKADERIAVTPSELGPIASRLAAAVAKLAGEDFPSVDGVQALPLPAERVEGIARRLWAARGRSLVVSGSQDVETQVLCNYLNHLLGNYRSTLDIDRPSRQRLGNDRELRLLLDELEERAVAALLIWGVNPVYDLPQPEEVAAAIQKTPLVISLDERRSETAELAHFVCPDPHYLESWGDNEPVPGVVSVQQPCLRPLGNTRALVETLAAWSGDPKSAYELMREHWQAHLFPRQSAQPSFEDFWDHAVHDGVVELAAPAVQTGSFRSDQAVLPSASDAAGPTELSLELYPKPAILDGRHAYNPWLQELPDPVTKVTWDNYACLSPALAAALGVRDGDVVEIRPMLDGKPSLELPVVLQPGQHDRIVAVALGYGAKASERFANVGPQWLRRKPTVNSDGHVGRNAAPLLRFVDGSLTYSGLPVKIRPTGGHEDLACTQAHHTITVPESLALPGGERRPAVRETTLDGYLHAQGGAEAHSGRAHDTHEDLWPADHAYTGHRWAMAIDLDACTGCSACVVSCQVENNIPVVGKDEMHRQREMHWMRIDRYYSGGDADVEVTHQPMLCQHCENAPCETVCPVLATVHSAEGLNQQVYNRCVGTRYCANNCPYKVRRFNWFDYAREDRLENLVLNPDVTVRSRGVMEKCSFCVQRIQEAKIEAKRRGEEIRDGEIQTACQQSCPAGAIVFGDLNDPFSRIAQLVKSPRHYRVLEELNVKPAVGYLEVVRRKQPGKEEAHHG
jgi:molybdopterin-containing oxidoreductase family iron-sulfur binding subunit